MSSASVYASLPRDEHIARAARTDAMIATLEGQIALDASERARLLGSFAAQGLIEPHRDHHAYALGADQADCELATGDARAMRGLMSIGPTALADMLVHAACDTPASHVTRLWPSVLDVDRSRFMSRGAAVDAKRLAHTEHVAPDQRTVFEAAIGRGAIVATHRDQRAFALGADLFYCGLFADDALALLGLMSIGPTRLAEQLRVAAARSGEIYVTRLWPDLLAARRDDYEARGRLVSWQRRWARYHTKFQTWLASSQRHEADWRGAPMTTGQRHLVRDTAIILDCEIPDEMNCGAAHDWLMAVGANALYRKEM